MALEYHKLFEDNRIPSAIERARKVATDLGHTMSEFLEVTTKDKNIAFIQSSGCTRCGHGVTIWADTKEFVIIGDAANTSNSL